MKIRIIMKIMLSSKLDIDRIVCSFWSFCTCQDRLEWQSRTLWTNCVALEPNIRCTVWRRSLEPFACLVAELLASCVGSIIEKRIKVV